jgi:hypothetical protein
MKLEVLRCSCGSLEHILIIEKDPDCPEVYIYPHLTKRPLLQRLIYGIKYIFGYQCRYGAFEEMILNAESFSQLMSIIRYVAPEKLDTFIKERYRSEHGVIS